MLIDETENKIQRNIGVSNVYTFLHAEFECIGVYVERKCVHLTKNGR